MFSQAVFQLIQRLNGRVSTMRHAPATGDSWTSVVARNFRSFQVIVSCLLAHCWVIVYLHACLHDTCMSVSICMSLSGFCVCHPSQSASIWVPHPGGGWMKTMVKAVHTDESGNVQSYEPRYTVSAVTWRWSDEGMNLWVRTFASFPCKMSLQLSTCDFLNMICTDSYWMILPVYHLCIYLSIYLCNIYLFM